MLTLTINLEIKYLSKVFELKEEAIASVDNARFDIARAISANEYFALIDSDKKIITVGLVNQSYYGQIISIVEVVSFDEAAQIMGDLKSAGAQIIRVSDGAVYL